MTDETEKDVASPMSKAIASGLAFSGLASVRNMEAQLRWLGFQAGLGLNILGWGGITVWMLRNPGNSEFAFMAMACLGAVFGNMVHYKILGRDGKFMDLWNRKLKDLEEVNGIEGSVKIFSSPRYDHLKSREPTVQWILRTSVVLCIMLWAWFALVAFLRFISS